MLKFHKRNIYLILSLFLILFVSPHSAFAEEEKEESSEPPTEETTAEEVMPEESEVNESEMDYPNPAEGEKGFEVSSNTDETGEVFDPRISYPELEGKKQFLTFITPDRQEYHIVVDYGRNSANVHLLKAINEEDIDSISEDGSSVESDSTFFGAEAKEVENSEEKEENVAVAAETEKSEQTNNSSTVIIFAVVIGVVLVLAYRKFKGTNATGYDED